MDNKNAASRKLHNGANHGNAERADAIKAPPDGARLSHIYSLYNEETMGAGVCDTDLKTELGQTRILY